MGLFIYRRICGHNDHGGTTQHTPAPPESPTRSQYPIPSKLGTRKSAVRPRWILVASGTHLVACASRLTCLAVLSLKVSRAAVSAAPSDGRRASVSARCLDMVVSCLRRTIPHRAVFEHMHGHTDGSGATIIFCWIRAMGPVSVRSPVPCKQR